ncbi:arylsulfatase I-like, partial [Oppia nitens]|uniref:arylsulfatase I-like n=1 Tax=Oppia nitens TaxID=1686743 RepID=UPI0023DC9B8F
ITLCNTITNANQLPNIIIFLVDDMGWADVGYRSDHMLTPNIDTLSADGITLNSYYTQPLCTPSRGALLSGVHPIHSGTQHLVFNELQPAGYPLDQKLLPEYLKQYDYATHAIGKWHLGFYKRDYTPTYRGFDTHFGTWGGFGNYYNHSMCSGIIYQTFNTCGLDYRQNMKLLTDQPDNQYSTQVYTSKTLDLIDQHNTSRPLFLYVAYQSLHSSYADNILQAPPDKYMNRFRHIESQNRRTYAAMAYSMDESIGAIVEKLYDRSMLSNSIILFTSDNGPQAVNVPSVFSNFGSAEPLRGSKSTLFEAGIRVPTFIWSPLLNTTGYVSDQLIHVTDIMPTLLDAIGADLDPFTKNNISYGMSQWESLSLNGSLAPIRTELLHNIDPIWNQSSIRWFDWKLLYGPNDPNYPHRASFASSWWPTIPVEDSQHIHMDQPSRDELKRADRLASRTYQVLSAMNRRPPTTTDYDVLEKTATIKCPPKPDGSLSSDPYRCQPDRQFCLFNIRHDPCEHRNIAHENLDLVDYMWHRLLDLNRTAVRPLALIPVDRDSYPDRHGGAWTNWLDDDDDDDIHGNRDEL